MEIKKLVALERIVKGFANHRRIQILELLQKHPKLSVIEIAENLDANYKTIAQHIQKMAIAGLIYKTTQSNEVEQSLTGRGVSILQFLRNIE
jgi:predicted transcriptional regulator